MDLDMIETQNAFTQSLISIKCLIMKLLELLLRLLRLRKERAIIEYKQYYGPFEYNLFLLKLKTENTITK